MVFFHDGFQLDIKVDYFIGTNDPVAAAEEVRIWDNEADLDGGGSSVSGGIELNGLRILSRFGDGGIRLDGTGGLYVFKGSSDRPLTFCESWQYWATTWKSIVVDQKHNIVFNVDLLDLLTGT